MSAKQESVTLRIWQMNGESALTSGAVDGGGAIKRAGAGAGSCADSRTHAYVVCILGPGPGRTVAVAGCGQADRNDCVVGFGPWQY